ncbi:glycosyl hydrolase family 28-related protein [Bacteroidota bacterium]
MIIVPQIIRKILLVFCVLALINVPDAGAKMRIFTHVDTSQFPPVLKQNLDHHPWAKGFLDVTKPPYNASPDGLTDATAALQLAIDHAYACNLVVFVPHGTYLVSDQLQCYLDPGPQLPNNPISSASQRKFGHIILGSEKGGQWPVIKLKDGSAVKDNTLFVFKYYDSLTETEDASRHYLGSLRNFEIDMGENPDISAVYNNGAQLCALENLKIYGNFNMGISTLPGSGGYTSNIEIIGGRIGIYQNNFRPNPTLFNIRLEGQSECGLMVLDTRGSLTMAGFSIKSPDSPSSTYHAVYIKNTNLSSELGARANLNLVDGSIEHSGNSASIYNYQQDLVIKNVFFKSTSIVESGAYSGNPDILAGNTGKWLYLSEYIFATAIDMGSVYRQKVNLRDRNNDFISKAELLDSLPPASLLTMHSWGLMPSWEDMAVVDLVVDYNATEDNDSDDDAIALQKAIDDISDPGHEHYGKTLFIPRGHFHIKSPVVLKSGVKIIGAAKNISVILVSEHWLPTAPVSAVSTENSEGPGIILSDLAIVGNTANLNGGLEKQKYICGLELKTGQSVIRDVQTSLRNITWGDNAYSEPFIRISGKGGGRIYGMCVDEGTRGAADPGYRLVKLSDSPSPVIFYQVSIEDASEELENEQTVHMEIDNCDNVSIFGFKYEKESELLHVSNTGSLTIIGGSGNYGLKDPDDDAIITITNTPNVFIGNISRKVQTGEISGKSFLTDGKISLPGDAPIVMYSKLNDTLPEIPDTFKLDFKVSEENPDIPVSNATIIIGEDAVYTDVSGIASLKKPAGNYAYIVVMSGFLEYSDSTSLKQDTTIHVSLLVNSASTTLSPQGVLLYPNPVKDILTVEFNEVYQDMVNYSIADASGRILISEQKRISAARTSIDLSGLKPGVYLITMSKPRGKLLIGHSFFVLENGY